MTLLHSRSMPAPPVAVVDALNSLLEAELNSVFRFMDESSPYLSRASAEVRRPLQAMVQTSHRRCHELAAAIESLGGLPRCRGLQHEEQYLAFLSIKFLLPKLVAAKELAIRRYENTLRVLANAPAAVNAVLERHLTEQRSELTALQKAAEQVAKGI